MIAVLGPDAVASDSPTGLVEDPRGPFRVILGKPDLGGLRIGWIRGKPARRRFRQSAPGEFHDLVAIKRPPDGFPHCWVVEWRTLQIEIYARGTG